MVRVIGSFEKSRVREIRGEIIELEWSKSKGNKVWFEISGGSGNRGLKKAGFHCITTSVTTTLSDTQDPLSSNWWSWFKMLFSRYPLTSFACSSINQSNLNRHHKSIPAEAIPASSWSTFKYCCKYYDQMQLHIVLSPGLFPSTWSPESSSVYFISVSARLFLGVLVHP